MSGPTTRDLVSFIDKAAETKPCEIAISGTRDGKPTRSVWRIEDKRMLLDPEAGGCAVNFLALRVCGVGKEEKPSWWWRTRI